MLIQEVVRGVGRLAYADALAVVRETGLVCAALRNGVVATSDAAEGLLSPEALERHRHDHPTFHSQSPYISATAGTYLEGSRWSRASRARFAFDTALDFAVLGPRRDGWIFYGYVFLLGRAAGRHAEFAEEVRDLHQHPAWSPYRGEGEIAVAVRIPPRRLRLAEFYDYDSVVRSIRNGRHPEPDDVIDNVALFEAPELLANARGVI